MSCADGWGCMTGEDWVKSWQNPFSEFEGLSCPPVLVIIGSAGWAVGNDGLFGSHRLPPPPCNDNVRVYG